MLRRATSTRFRRRAPAATALLVCSSGIAQALSAAAATPPPPPPTGATTVLDPVSCAITGWARNPGYAGPIRVHVYSGGPAGQGGTWLAAIFASLPSPDGLNDGYEYIFPTWFNSSIYVYAIGVDSSGTTDNDNPLLAVAGSRQLACHTPPSQWEGSQSVTVSQLGLTVKLGQVAPLMKKGDYSISGGAPDNHMSAVVNGGTETFFQCYTAATDDELSCASRNSDIDHLWDLKGLITTGPGSGTFQTVMPGKVPGDPYQSEYAAISATWRDPSTGTIHAWYHEEVPVPGCNGARYASVGYATSTDGGTTFIKHGQALTSPNSMTSTCTQQGINAPEVIPWGNFLFMYFDYWSGSGSGGTGIARAPQSDPTAWQKWYGGSFSSVAIGGPVTPIISNGTPGNHTSWHGSVIWNQALGRFVMVNSDFVNEGAFYIRTSYDMLTWSPEYLVVPATPAGGYRYPELFGQDEAQMGSAGWLYFGRTPAPGVIGPDTVLMRRAITITP